jgi:hypothetical protein
MTEQEDERRPHVEVWQQPDGAWRWRFVALDGEERVELPSNEPDSSREEAEHNASVAYPDLPVEVREPPQGDAREGHGRSGGPRRLPHVVRPAVLAVVTVALAVRHPRWWTVAPAVVAVATAVHRLRTR